MAHFSENMSFIQIYFIGVKTFS